MSVTLDTTRLDHIASELGLRRDQIVKAFAFLVEGEAKKNAAVDTGAMRNSIYTHTQDSDGYSAAAGAAEGKNPGVETSPIPAPTGNIIATVGPAVNYAIFVELGTSKMGAQPFLFPAVEHLAQKFNDGVEWQDLVKP